RQHSRRISFIFSFRQGYYTDLDPRRDSLPKLLSDRKFIDVYYPSSTPRNLVFIFAERIVSTMRIKEPLKQNPMQKQEEHMSIDASYTSKMPQRSARPMSLLSRVCLMSAIVVAFLLNATGARADVVLDWNAIMVTTLTSQNPFAQGRFAAITQLAV